MSVAGIQITSDLDLVEMSEITYEAISSAVGGYIQLVPLSGAFEGFSLYVHEEGKLLGLPFNDIATAVWEASYGKTDIILGNAVLVSSQTDEEGSELPLTEEQVEAFTKATQQAVLNYAKN